MVNYYLGGAERWRTGVPAYARVRYRDVFPGIDLAVYGKQGAIEYDWLVAPGADPSAIRFTFEGGGPPALDASGDLLVGDLRHRKPVLYQQRGGERIPVEGGFVLRGQTVAFRAGSYDPARELVIDPLVVWSRNFGGAGYLHDGPGRRRLPDTGYAVALDRWLGIYVAGITYSDDLSIPCESGRCAAYFLTRLDHAGDNPLYTTYFGAREAAPGAPPQLPGKPSLAVDPDGFAVVAGTAAPDSRLPLVDALDAQPDGPTDAFAMKLDPMGEVVWSTLLGGSGPETAGNVVVDPYGHVWLAGVTGSSDFPVTLGEANASPGATQAFVARIEFTGRKLLHAACLGPAESAVLALDMALSPHVAGVTRSREFPVTGGVFQPACRGQQCLDGYVMKVDVAGRVIWSTYLGGSGPETLNTVAVGPSGRVYVAGATESPDFPVTPGVVQNWKPTPRAAWVAVLQPAGDELVYATYLGGSPREEAHALAVDPVGNAFVVGATGWRDFPSHRAVQPGFAQGMCPLFGPSGGVLGLELCGGPGFLTVLTPSGERTAWSTFLGGGESDAAHAVAVDGSGAVYIAGNGLRLGRPVELGTGHALARGVGLLKMAAEGEPVYFRSDSVTEAAAFRPGLPRPGGLASIFTTGLGVEGTVTANEIPLPYELAGVSVRVGGAQAPLLSVTGTGAMQQINFQVPFEAQSREVEVRRGAVSSFAEPLPVGPGIFGVRHQSGAPVTAADPAAPGETIVIYATGLGPLSSYLPSGYPAPGPAPAAETPVVRIGNLAADVVYAGLAPGYVGLYQVNARVPSETPSGNTVVTLESALPFAWGSPPAAWVQSNTVQLAVR